VQEVVIVLHLGIRIVQRLLKAYLLETIFSRGNRPYKMIRSMERVFMMDKRRKWIEFTKKAIDHKGEVFRMELSNKTISSALYKPNLCSHLKEKKLHFSSKNIKPYFFIFFRIHQHSKD
jgi:hypothetical protein